MAWFAVPPGLGGSRRPSNVIVGTLIFGFSESRLSNEAKAGVACRQPETEAVAVDHDIDKIRIIEGGGGPLESSVAELPAGRPLIPKDAAQGATMLRQALASTLQLEQMLIPEHLLQSRFEGVLNSLHVDERRFPRPWFEWSFRVDILAPGDRKKSLSLGRKPFGFTDRTNPGKLKCDAHRRALTIS